MSAPVRIAFLFIMFFCIEMLGYYWGEIHYLGHLFGK